MAVMSSTVCILLSFVPVLATSVGFVLSVVSTAAILFVVPIILRRLSLHLSMVPTIVISALIVPLVAQLACTPVLVAIDPRIGLWSVAANALAAPAVLPATVLGFVSMVCGDSGSSAFPACCGVRRCPPGSVHCAHGGSSAWPGSVPDCPGQPWTGRNLLWGHWQHSGSSSCWPRAYGCWCAGSCGDPHRRRLHLPDGADHRRRQDEATGR